MNLLHLIETALRAIAANPLRSALTTLGIVIGVGSVIVMGAVGAGARQEVDRQIGNLGTSVLVVNPSAQVYGGRSSGPGTNRPLSEDDLVAIETKVSGVVAISGQLWASATVVRGNANTWTRIWGVHRQYLELRNWSLDSGREISEQDVAGQKRVALIGQSVAKVLFGDENPLARQVFRVRNLPFLVVGVLSAKGRSLSGDDHDDTVLVPMTTARRYLVGLSRSTPFQVGQISVKFREGTNLADAQEELEQILRQSRRVVPGGDDTFGIGNLTEAIKARAAAQATLGWLLGAAAISLVVGGIGIMSIMLVSVAERTREIGLRKALGARYRDIALEFLIEAVTLCVLGGLAGIALGIIAAHLTAGLAGWPVVVTVELVLMALAAAASTGIIFGFLPARRAAQLQPIDSLRSE